MKVRLMDRDRDFDPAEEPPAAADDLTHDLGLDILLRAMADGDRFLFNVSRVAIFASLDDPAAISYRQDVLADCLRHPDVVRELYALAVDAIERERKVWGWSTRYPESLLHRSVDVLGKFSGSLRAVRQLADTHAGELRSEGFRRLFAEISAELDDEYLATMEEHVERLRFRDGVVVSAELGSGNRATGFVLRRRTSRPGWRERIGLPEPGTYTYVLAPRDEAGARALTELRARGIALAAISLARSADHILAWFRQLRAELAFYVACLNVHATLTAKGEPACRPEPLPPGRPVVEATGLYDACLSLSMPSRVVGNDVAADGRSLVMVTGANRGGKSTFLRSLGQAQLMLQCGMFVPAGSFRADVRRGVFTHFRREEDVSLRSGKLDEELARMSAIVDRATPGSLVLLNESFSSTNEREGSEIGRQIVRALLASGVKVAYVTHLFDLADGLYRAGSPDALFLRAERLADGHRTFRVVEGEPLPTSHGQDVFRRVFGAAMGPGEASAGQPHGA